MKSHMSSLFLCIAFITSAISRADARPTGGSWLSPSSPAGAVTVSDLTPDTTFANSGIALIDFNDGSVRHDIGLRVFPDSDGGYWVVGEHSGGGSGIQMAIAKTTANGLLDPFFNVTGKKTVASTFTRLVDVARGPGNKFYFVGAYVAPPATDTDIEIDCLDAAGNPCAEFGASGITRAHFDLGVPGRRDDTPTRIIATDDSLYVLGATDTGTSGSNQAAFVLKLSVFNGAFDPAFGRVPAHPGLVIFNSDIVPNGADVAFDAVVYSPAPAVSRLVMVGESQRMGTDVDGFVLSIDGTTGSPDGFIDDAVYFDLGSIPVDTLRRIIRRHNGGFVVAGYSDDDSGTTDSTQLLMAAYRADGTRDHSFGLPGDLGQLHLLYADVRNEPYALAERADSRDLVVCLTMAESTADEHPFEGVLQLGATGNIEHAFARVDEPALDNKTTECRDLAISPTNQVLTAGYRMFSFSFNDYDMVLARFNLTDTLFADLFGGPDLD